jgi:hypothetical protein
MLLGVWGVVVVKGLLLIILFSCYYFIRSIVGGNERPNLD